MPPFLRTPFKCQQITCLGLRALTPLPLARLDVSGCLLVAPAGEVEDGCAAVAAALTGLTALRMHGQGPSDDGAVLAPAALEPLSALTGLRELSVGHAALAQPLRLAAIAVEGRPLVSREMRLTRALYAAGCAALLLHLPAARLRRLRLDAAWAFAPDADAVVDAIEGAGLTALQDLSFCASSLPRGLGLATLRALTRLRLRCGPRGGPDAVDRLVWGREEWNWGRRRHGGTRRGARFLAPLPDGLRVLMLDNTGAPIYPDGSDVSWLSRLTALTRLVAGGNWLLPVFDPDLTSLEELALAEDTAHGGVAVFGDSLRAVVAAAARTRPPPQQQQQQTALALRAAAQTPKVLRSMWLELQTCAAPQLRPCILGHEDTDQAAPAALELSGSKLLEWGLPALTQSGGAPRLRALSSLSLSLPAGERAVSGADAAALLPALLLSGRLPGLKCLALNGLPGAASATGDGGSASSPRRRRWLLALLRSGAARGSASSLPSLAASSSSASLPPAAPLVRLAVCGCPSLLPDALQAVAAVGATLRSLDLSRSAIDDAGFARLRGLTALTRLDVRWCHRLSDAALSLAAARMPRLAALAAAGVTRATDLGLTHLACALHRSLLELSLGPAAGVTDAGLREVARLTALTWLELRRCPAITAWGLAALAGGAAAPAGAEAEADAAAEAQHQQQHAAEVGLAAGAAAAHELQAHGQALGAAARDDDLDGDGEEGEQEEEEAGGLRRLSHLDVTGCALDLDAVMALSPLTRLAQIVF